MSMGIVFKMLKLKKSTTIMNEKNHSTHLQKHMHNLMYE